MDHRRISKYTDSIDWRKIKMREYNEKSQKETDIAFALASFLLNVLILLVLCGSVWMFHSLIVQPNSGAAFLRDFTMFR
jgi:hypothetical protein